MRDQPELLGGTVGLMGRKGRIGQPQTRFREGLAARKLVGEPGKVLPGFVQSSQTEPSHRQVRQGEIGDVAPGIGGQILLERRDCLGVTSGIEVSLAEQELGIGRNGAGRFARKLGKHAVGLGGTSKCSISQRQVIAGGQRNRPRQLRRWRAFRGFSGGSQQRLKNDRGFPGFPFHCGRSGFDQTHLVSERTARIPGCERAGQTPGRGRVGPVKRGLGSPLDGIVGPGIAWGRFGDSEEVCLGLGRMVLLQQRLGRSKLQRRNQRRLGEMLDGLLEGGQRFPGMVLLELDGRQLEGSPGTERLRGIVGQGAQQHLGLTPPG